MLCLENCDKRLESHFCILNISQNNYAKFVVLLARLHEKLHQMIAQKNFFARIA